MEPYLRVLDSSIEQHTKDRPEWRTEVVLSIIRWALGGLKFHLEDAESQAAWESPFVELHYPVEWNWDLDPSAKEGDTVQSGELFGHIKAPATRDFVAVLKLSWFVAFMPPCCGRKAKRRGLSSAPS
jgi:hypothetical protein